MRFHYNMGGQLFHPKLGNTPTDLSTVSQNVDNGWDKLRCSLYRNEYLGFQIYDVKHSVHVNFYLERDHELIMREAYCLISILLPLDRNVPPNLIPPLNIDNYKAVGRD